MKRSQIVAVRSEASGLRFIWGPGPSFVKLVGCIGGRPRLGDVWDTVFRFLHKKSLLRGVCFPEPLTFNSWLPTLPLMIPPPTSQAWNFMFLTE